METHCFVNGRNRGYYGVPILIRTAPARTWDLFVMIWTDHGNSLIHNWNKQKIIGCTCHDGHNSRCWRQQSVCCAVLAHDLMTSHRTKTHLRHLMMT